MEKGKNMKRELLYTGKVKNIYSYHEQDKVIMHYTDDATAFNGVKKEALKNKGKINNLFNAFIMERLEKNGVNTHFVKLLNDQESIVKKLKMIPVECVIRNYSAGSVCKKIGITKGKKFDTPVFEFFLKDDILGDPMINESHIHALKLASDNEIKFMKEETFKINEILKGVFDKAGFNLVDYKIEFGHFNNKIILGDEFSPDGCRIWDKITGESYDKDRFRNDLGDTIENYEFVARKIGAIR